jgi:hypothetical protein
MSNFLEVGVRARFALPAGAAADDALVDEPQLDPGTELGMSARAAVPQDGPLQATFGAQLGAAITPVRRTIDATVSESWSSTCWDGYSYCGGSSTSTSTVHHVSSHSVPVVHVGGQLGLLWTVVPALHLEVGAIVQTDTKWKRSESFSKSCSGSGSVCLAETIAELSPSVTYRPQAVPFFAATWRLGDLFLSGQVFTTATQETTQVALGGAATAKWQF